MKIQHIRNATMVIEAAQEVILVDPMLNPKGASPTLTFFRHKPQRNPTVELPENTQESLERVTHCLITHLHADHIDKAGMGFLAERNVPVTCSKLDEKKLKSEGLNVTQALDYWKRAGFLGGKIEGIPCRHGYGFVARPMGNVMGFYLELPGEPSVYLSSDTIYTQDVSKVLKDYQPSISIVACGAAQLDLFKPLLMTMEDIIRFTKDAPGKVIMNHMEAVNHCPTTRKELKYELTATGLIDKSYLPEDGEWIELS